jgi:hypothetical protein
MDDPRSQTLSDPDALSMELRLNMYNASNLPDVFIDYRYCTVTVQWLIETWNRTL